MSVLQIISSLTLLGTIAFAVISVLPHVYRGFRYGELPNRIDFRPLLLIAVAAIFCSWAY